MDNELQQLIEHAVQYVESRPNSREKHIVIKAMVELIVELERIRQLEKSRLRELDNTKWP
jgi:hypothetical protein